MRTHALGPQTGFRFVWFSRVFPSPDPLTTVPAPFQACFALVLEEVTAERAVFSGGRGWPVSSFLPQDTILLYFFSQAARGLSVKFKAPIAR